MGGFIREQHLTEAEEAFPGITALYRTLALPPRTFLQLVALWERCIAVVRL